MNKLLPSDVFPPSVYEPIRDAMRRRIIDIKRPRRVALGPDVSLVFENRATMIFQVCEMLRAEHIVEPVKIADEIAVYNTLLPDPGELAATLFIEIVRSEDIRPAMHRLVGIDRHVALWMGGERVPAVFEAGRSDEERISAVQYVRFRPGPAAAAALAKEGSELVLACDLPAYPHRVILDEETRQSLAADLA